MTSFRRKLHSNANYVVAIGSSLMIALMISLAVTGISHMGSIKDAMDSITTERAERINILTAMRRIVRERSLTMYAIYLTKDPFQRDEEFMHFNALAEQFIKLRTEFEKAGVLPQQRQMFDKGLELISRSAPLQENIVDLMMDQEHTDIYTLMSAIDLPLEKHILATFDKLIEIEQEITRNANVTAKQDYEEAYYMMVLIGIIVTVLGILITALVIHRTRRIEGDLYEAKEQAEVTLHAIGDAVITTNSAGEVVYLNPAAEHLTGWRHEDAVGRNIAEVYCVKDENGKNTVDHPIYQGKIDGQAMALHPHCILTSRDENEYIVKDTSSPLYNHGGNKFGMVLVSRDVTHERTLANQLSWQARHDSLTGLANRRQFEHTLMTLLSNFDVEGAKHALLYLDLDQFKLVNDTCGHIAGDELLKQIVILLKSNIREADLLARLGGDEFGLILEGCPMDKAERIANQLVEAVREFRFVWKGKVFSLGVSIGLAMIDEHRRDAETVLSAADAACFIAKDKGRNRVWIHQLDDAEVAQRHGEMEWASKINTALEENRFLLYYQKVQPITENDGRHYYEFLVRMVNEAGEIISPMSFIPAAERYGTMVAIDRWVLRRVFSWLGKNSQKIKPHDVYSINLSGQSLCDDSFLQFCVSEIVNSKIDPRNICFEITETAAISNWSHASAFVTALKSRGCRFALDDFGSGMSSFNYLKNLPVDYIKIDGAFVSDMLTDSVDQVMVNAINQIGQSMGIKTIAEFVENQEILEMLKQMHVDFAQGFGVHVPEALEPLNFKVHYLSDDKYKIS
ncbi:MAG: EAL domain-containing protein [Gammaproteobacteria bacterium]|jgi:diguanylate cyclase (GGDEF)-like protein/PAS domain S-box-containing protein